MKKIKLFESAVCTCDKNPNSKENKELLRIYVIVDTLKKQCIGVERYNIMGRYPSRNEFTTLLGIPKETLINKDIKSGCTCGCNGDCC